MENPKAIGAAEWFKEVSWLLPNWSWLVIAVVVIIAAVVIIVVAVCKNKGKADGADVEADVAENSEKAENADVSRESAEAKTDADEISAEKTEKQPEKQPEKPVVKADKPVEKPVEKQSVKEEAKKVNKVYHISKRKDDGKWQVKAAGGSKAVKLFRTQAEAIDYAKALAESQEARIVIHKADGSFRTLNYKK